MQIKKASKLHITGLCEGNSPVAGEFPSQRTSNAENVSIWWRHHVTPHNVESQRQLFFLTENVSCLDAKFVIITGMGSRRYDNLRWCHMMTSSNGNISALLAICVGIHRPLINSPHNLTAYDITRYITFSSHLPASEGQKTVIMVAE